ncbi:Pyruvate dehydrogenase (cytochrome) [Thiorhodococcus drewsii AZ1]|uniref:Pyruvate dehydrogenase (Cytochrome) n=1 Tax=Thiorhodococcus drewsii AZ1 TaxID=765913 RepID=G2E2B6_9GAMM|nr:ubiquinone-dependent pyruvate dehydrogenase [Thiorhodococcus drewsii]EGV30832.1 Pyruvate dehydrogenase (cytochrome) [Thiorhodococcus drewsii AZ1]
MSTSVSEVIVDTLVQAGTRRCYGIVGDTINHFTDAIRRSELDWVHVRHEEVGGLAAGGEAYMTGELAACAGTCGPGSLHFLNGIFESHRNGAPVVLIASNVDRHEEGLGFPQEVDQKRLYEQCSVFCERISHPDQARRITAQAAQAALARRGVAVVIVNGDILQESCADSLRWTVNRATPVTIPSTDELEAIAEAINGAARITLYVGIGARGARERLIAFAERIKAPIVHTTRSKEFVEPDNPYNVGMTGILGNRAGMEAVADCDLLLTLGTDFAYTQFYPDEARIIQVDIDPTRLGRRTPVEIGVVGDVGATLDALSERVAPRDSEKHLQKALNQWRRDQDDYRARGAEQDPDLIHPQQLTQVLDRLAAQDAIFTADGGSPMVWLLRHLSANGHRRFLTSLLHGTMANAYPQAIGIQQAYPDRQVIALCGDGGMTMLMGDLLTLVQERLPVKLLVFNNGSLGFVEMEQRVEGLLDAYTELKNPDFGKVAEACGLYGARVDRADRLEEALASWLAHDGPALLDVAVNRFELVMPPKIEVGQVASTALFGLKAVLNGRTDEVVDLLKNNFVK